MNQKTYDDSIEMIDGRIEQSKQIVQYWEGNKAQFMKHKNTLVK